MVALEREAGRDDLKRGEEEGGEGLELGGEKEEGGEGWVRGGGRKREAGRG